MAPGVLGQVPFRVAFAVYAAGLVLWLTVGMLPILVDAVPAIANVVGTLAAGTGPLAKPAELLLHPTIPMTGESGNGLLQYAFSLLNLVLGVLLIVRRPNDLVPRLLALGLLGTAATFNLPSHEAFHILGSPWPIALLHFTFHIVSGVAYLWAVTLFPDGRLPNLIAASRRTVTVAVVMVTAAVSLICWWSDFLAHPQFFVIFFGILIPVVGVAAQTLRLTDQATAPGTRRSARLLIGALLPALALAVIWCLARGIAGFDSSVGAAASQAADRLQDLFPAVFAIVPVVLFAGVLRYRLFDIDRLLSRVLVYGLIVIGSGLVYLVAVVTGGALAGGASWWTVVVLAAAAVVLEPAWSLAQRWANRVVFGQNLGPAAAMKTLISGLEQVSSTTELDQLVDISVRATRAVGAQLWLSNGDDLWTLRAATPAHSIAQPTGTAGPVLVTGRCWPLMHNGAQLGVLTVDLAAGETLPGGDRALLADLASHAGLLVHNAVLADQLAEHVRNLTERATQLSTARRRLVAAQDRERRRIERDLHDGAQQTLVAVMLGMRMAAAQQAPTPGSVPDRATPAPPSMLAQLNRELDASRVELAEIAGGSLPAVLRAGGLQGGLTRAAATARRTGLTVDLLVDLSGQVAERLDDDTVATVYFCCSEALQNVVKYANATHAGIDVTATGGELRFTVTDDGTGIDPALVADPEGGLRGLDDRASLHGGWIAVDSSPGGTRVRGAVPVSAVLAGLPFNLAVAADTPHVIVDPVGTARKAATP
jgi:signal transduction histidine kinase